MTSNLSQFHYLASTVPNKFDFEAEDFDISNIYQFYSLKVCKSRCAPSRVAFIRAARGLTQINLFVCVSTAPAHARFSLFGQNVC